MTSLSSLNRRLKNNKMNFYVKIELEKYWDTEII